jgi:phosphoribosylformimino-5-aminoimidazole carboxamide ribotide isomerase
MGGTPILLFSFHVYVASASFNGMSLVILPSIDLRHGKVVRLKQGDYSQQLNYDIDPMQVAASYAKAGATWMHVIDLDGAKEGKQVQLELLGKLAASSGLRVQIGGGIRSEEDIQRLFKAGVARAVISFTIRNMPGRSRSRWMRRMASLPRMGGRKSPRETRWRLPNK